MFLLEFFEYALLFNFAFLELYTRKYVCISCIGITVIEFRYSTVAKQVTKFLETSRPFRNGYRKDTFFLFANFGTFRYMSLSVKIDIRAGINCYQ